MSDYGVHLSEYGLHLHVTRSGLEVTSTRVQFSAPPADRRPGSGTRTREPRVRSRASGVGAGSLEVPPARRRSAAIYYATTVPTYEARPRAGRSGRVWRHRAQRYDTHTGDNRRVIPRLPRSAWAHWRGGPRLPRPVGGTPRSLRTTLLPVPTYEALRGPPTACGCGRSGHVWRHRVQRYILHTHTAIRAITGARIPRLPRASANRVGPLAWWSEVIRDSPRTRTDHVGAQRGAGSAPGVVPRRRPRPGTVRVHIHLRHGRGTRFDSGQPTERRLKTDVRAVNNQLGLSYFELETVSTRC